MKQTPSALKWLAEKRARLAHDLAQTRSIAVELTHRADVLEADLAALDRSLRLYDERIDPNNIESVNGWKGTYGKRGALRDGVLEVLKEYSPQWLTTSNISALICAKFGLYFQTGALRKHWYTGSFRGTLKRLEVDGLIEHECDPDAEGPVLALWRLRAQPSGTLADLVRSTTKASAAAE